MQEVLSLSFPFFGLIFLGFFVGKVVNLPESGLSWLNFFIIYLALPALFFQILSETPIEQLKNMQFVVATTLASYAAFTIAFFIGVMRTGGDIPSATIQGLVAGYGNVGYLGIGLSLVALGTSATVPVALIFSFDCTLFFVLTPILMAIGGSEPGGVGTTALTIVRRIFAHPFILATMAGIAAAAVDFEPPMAVDTLLNMLRGAAAPCALFALGVTVALRPLPTGEAVGEVAILIAIKLLVHPVLAFLMVSWVGGVDQTWLLAAVLMAALPPATNVFVLATQYQTYVERASSAVLIGTIVSVVTVTGVLFLFNHELLPVTPF